MQILTAIILANLSMSLISVTGLLGLLRLSKHRIEQNIYLLVSLSAGTLLGGAFLHLLPEAAEVTPGIQPFAVTLISFIGFFILEKIIHYRHCHTDGCDEHGSFGYINLVGDAIHNFIDGVIVAAAFLTDMRLGVVTTLAVLLHEIPQEVGDMGVLLHAGFSKRRAVWSNLLVSLTALLGGIVGYMFAGYAEVVSQYLLPVAAGSFLYLASSDLLPEIRKEEHSGRFTVSVLFVCIGIALMALFTVFE
jgi:zinc and cadmium transporter